MNASQTVGGFAISEESSRGGTVVLVLVGDADLHVAPELRSVVVSALDRGVRSMVIDLSEVEFLDSTVLGVLLAALKRMRSAGGELRVVIASNEIRRLFEITVLDRVFSVDATRREALAALEPSSAS